MRTEDMMHAECKPDRCQELPDITWKHLPPLENFKKFTGTGACNETAYGTNMSLNRKLEKAKEGMKKK